jgi:xanthine/CO dehydrogenase XdhC/CoxF family maturation factor
MLLTPDGRSWGMVSGGCLEHDVLDHARRALQSDEPRVVRYDSTSDDDIIFGTGLGCNGIIDVFVEPVTNEFRESLIQSVELCQSTRQTGAIATLIETKESFRSIGSSSTHDRHVFVGTDGNWSGNKTLAALLELHIRNDGETTSQEVILNDARIFVQPLLPSIQLAIFGGWLDVVPLIRIAKEIGFQVIVIDSRRRSSSQRIFQEADKVLPCSPEEALAQIQFDARTVAVVMNHHFERDQEALAALAKIALPFLGTLGPKRRLEKMLAALRSSGVVIPDEFAQNIHGPVGLDLGAKTPEEIALSILAEILSVLNARNAEPIRDRKISPQNSSSAEKRAEHSVAYA